MKRTRRVTLSSIGRRVLLLLVAAGACDDGSGGEDECSPIGEEAREYVPEEGVPTIRANGLEFAYLEAGSGPLVLLLHGFPDTPHGFDELRHALAQAGFRAVSPFMRGYAPTQIPTDGDYGAEILGEDVLGLIEALGEDEAIVVGNDFGAVAAYAAAHLDPSKLTALVTIGTPHPAGQMVDDSFVLRAPHFGYLPPEQEGEAIMSDRDFAHVDVLYARWSPTWSARLSDSEPVKNVFAHPGSLTAALGYYRALPSLDPALFASPISLPTLLINGADDRVLLPAAFEASAAAFTGPLELHTVDGGHFLHRENADAVQTIVLEFLATALD